MLQGADEVKQTLHRSGHEPRTVVRCLIVRSTNGLIETCRQRGDAIVDLAESLGEHAYVLDHRLTRPDASHAGAMRGRACPGIETNEALIVGCHREAPCSRRLGGGRKGDQGDERSGKKPAQRRFPVILPAPLGGDYQPGADGAIIACCHGTAPI